LCAFDQAIVGLSGRVVQAEYGACAEQTEQMTMHTMMSLQRVREKINMTLNGKRTAAARSADVIITSQTLMNDAACGII